MKRTLLTLGFAAVFSFSSLLSSAQERSSVLVGRGTENWFISVGGGINTIYDNSAFSPVQPAAQLNFGKWFTPSFGLQAGYNGILAQPVAAGQQTWFSGEGRFNLNLIHIDVLWNFRNTFVNYQEDRVWNPALYLRSGMLWLAGNNASRHVAALGGGFSNSFRVSEHVSIALDLSAVLASERALRTNYSGRFTSFLSATAGLVIDLGKRRFKRPAPVAVAQTPDPNIIDKLQVELQESDARLALAQNRLGKIQKEVAKLEELKDGRTYEYKEGLFTEALPAAPVTVQAAAQPEILYFNLGKTTLDERELARLEFYAQNTFQKSQKLLISGAADSGTGSREVNERLSRQRAEYVKNILVKQFGYNPANITTTADVIPSTSPIKGRIVTIEVR